MSLPRRVPAAILALLTAAVLVAAPAAGTTALTVSGTRAFHDPPFPDQLVPAFFAGDTVDHIDYPAALIGMDRSIAVAAAGIAAGIADTVGPVVVAGFSQGAIAVAYAKRDVMALPADTRPDRTELSFLTIGDPSGPAGILKSLRGKVPVLSLTPFVAPETPYDSVVVNGEYDGWGDFPDRPWNLLSVVNALLGAVYVHGRYETIPGGLDLSAVPSTGITTTVNSLGGSTTSYLIPTPKLPLVQPLRDIGVPEPVVATIEKPLKEIVDRGYVRNDVRTVTPPIAATVGEPTGRARVRGPAAAAATSVSGADTSAGPGSRPRRGHTDGRSAAA